MPRFARKYLGRSIFLSEDSLKMVFGTTKNYLDTFFDILIFSNMKEKVKIHQLMSLKFNTIYF